MEHTKEIGFELRTLSNLIKRYVDNLPAKQYADKVTGVHGWIICYLYNNQDKDIFQRDLENEFQIRRSTVTAIIQLMEKNNLITREGVEYDARLKKITLTKNALEIHFMIQKELISLEERMKDGISKQEIEIFFRIMEKIKNNISGGIQ